jgi:hypothetical protein
MQLRPYSRGTLGARRGRRGHNPGVREPEPSAAASEQIWLVLQRDLTVWLRGVGRPSFLTMVLDLTDRGNRAVEEGPTPGESLRNALYLATTQPMRGMEPRIPDRIQVPIGLTEQLRPVLGRLETEAGFRSATTVEEITPEDGAEWVFDDLIAQMAGRQPAEERLQAEDAIFLYEQARRFMEAQPWTRWTSDDALLVELKLGSQRMEGIATVIGHQSTQPGLLLVPGRKRVGEMMVSYSALPTGTLLMQLEGAEGQPDLFLRARRYGWPADAAVTPNFISVRDGGFVELDRRESWPMALALAGVVAHFQRGEVADTRAQLDLPTGRRGRYHVSRAPEAIEKEQKGPRGELLGIKITSDLMPRDSDVQIGVMGLELLQEFRREARVSVPPTAPFPDGITTIPMIVMTPSNRDYAGVVDRIRRAKPIGATVIESESGPMLTIVGERAGFMVASDRPSARVWKRNITDSDGAHVLIVTDGVINKEAPDPERPGAGELGQIYGLFECMLRGGSTQAVPQP